MKKLITLLLVLLLAATGATADVLCDGWKDADNAEIQAAIEELKAELEGRMATQGDGDSMVLFQQDGITVTLSGENHAFANLFNIGVIIENNSDKEIRVTLQEASINGWEVSTIAPGKVQAGNKKKAELTFNFEKAGLASETEIQEIKFILAVIDTGSFSKIGATQEITWTPGD